MANTITLTRKELYSKVWTTPVLKLAKEFNLSDVGLAKICKKHDIPKPGLGYWAKLEHGKHVEKRPLPSPQNNPDITIDTSGKYQNYFPITKMTPEKAAKIKEQFQVPDVLRNPHPLIQQTQKLLRENKDTYHRILEVLDIEVCRSEYGRALRFMDAFIKQIEKRGHTVRIENDWRKQHQFRTAVLIKNISIYVRIYLFNNRMTFGINDHFDGRKNWGNSKAMPLEDRLYDIILRLLQTARKDLYWVIKRRLEERERKRIEAIRLEEERLRQEEQKRIHDLEKCIACWKKSLEIREYLDYSKKYVTQKHGGYDEDSEFGKWLTWAYDYAEQVYPMK